MAVENTSIIDMNATEGMDTMTDNMTAVDGAANGGLMANDTMGGEMGGNDTMTAGNGSERRTHAGENTAQADGAGRPHATPTESPANRQVFCTEINRRIAGEECQDLTETAAQAKQGSAALNVPDMVRGQPSPVQLAVSLAAPSTPADANGGPPPAEVVKDLPGRTESYSPIVGRDMRAELTGSGFKVEPRSPASQRLNPGDATTWDWDVTPERSSASVLTIKTSVEGIRANGDRVVLRSTTQTRSVKVRVRWYDWLRDGLTDAPGWIKLVTAVLVALAALAAAWWAFIRAAKGAQSK